MPTVIDALLIELQLDPAKFQKGQKQATESFRKTKEEAGRTAKEIEHHGKQAGQFFVEMRKQLLLFFGAFTAGKGMKEFISDLTRMDAQTGRTASLIGLTAETLSKWQGAAVAAGGSSEGITSSLRTMSLELQRMLNLGESSVVPYFNALGISLRNTNGQWKTADQLLLDLADRFSKMDPQRAAFIGKSLGLDEATINLLRRGRDAVVALLNEQQRLGVVSQQQAQQSSELLKSWENLKSASTALGREIDRWLAPLLIELNKHLTALAVWAREHGEFLRALFVGLAAAVTAFAAVLLSPIAGFVAMAAGIGAVIVALALLWDDFSTWLAGGKAELAGFWDPFVEDIKVVIGWLKKLRDLLPHLGAVDGDIDPLTGQRRGGGGGLRGPSGLIDRAPSGDRQAMIRAAAKKYGIDPDIAVAVARSEGLGRAYAGDNGSSFGAFQLHMGGLAGGGNAVGGLGDLFRKETGLDPRDPSTEAAQIDWALKYASSHGWGPWHGWKGTPLAGIPAQLGSAGAIASNDARSYSTTTSDTRIGQVNVYTQATDAAGIASAIRPAIKGNLAISANNGLN